jgi:hypothetical protein
MTGIARRIKTGTLICATALALAAGGVSDVPSLGTEEAEAARQINGPAWFTCDRYPATISISPPRIWANYGTEQVLWSNQIQRWNSSTQRWYNYYKFDTWSSYNYYGQGVTAWTGGRFVNSTLNLRVTHRGHYRVIAVVGGTQSSTMWRGFVGGGAYCYIP